LFVSLLHNEISVQYVNPGNYRMLDLSVFGGNRVASIPAS